MGSLSSNAASPPPPRPSCAAAQPSKHKLSTPMQLDQKVAEDDVACLPTLKETEVQPGGTRPIAPDVPTQLQHTAWEQCPEQSAKGSKSAFSVFRTLSRTALIRLPGSWNRVKCSKSMGKNEVECEVRVLNKSASGGKEPWLRVDAAGDISLSRAGRLLSLSGGTKRNPERQSSAGNIGSASAGTSMEAERAYETSTAPLMASEVSSAAGRPPRGTKVRSASAGLERVQEKPAGSGWVRSLSAGSGRRKDLPPSAGWLTKTNRVQPIPPKIPSMQEPASQDFCRMRPSSRCRPATPGQLQKAQSIPEGTTVAMSIPHFLSSSPQNIVKGSMISTASVLECTELKLYTDMHAHIQCKSLYEEDNHKTDIELSPRKKDLFHNDNVGGKRHADDESVSSYSHISDMEDESLESHSQRLSCMPAQRSFSLEPCAISQGKWTADLCAAGLHACVKQHCRASFANGARSLREPAIGMCVFSCN